MRNAIMLVAIVICLGAHLYSTDKPQQPENPRTDKVQNAARKRSDKAKQDANSSVWREFGRSLARPFVMPLPTLWEISSPSNSHTACHATATNRAPAMAKGKPISILGLVSDWWNGDKQGGARIPAGTGSPKSASGAASR